MKQTGTLYIVATPIGNMRDITLRALDTLREADVIAAEDTRHTQKLLNHYEIKTKVLSFHEHSAAARRGEIAAILEQGRDVALVSDAGTPLVSDPGFALVEECVRRNIPVVSLPGACAAVAAVTLCGMDCSEFVFAGFTDARAAARRKKLAWLRGCGVPFILYESPNRVLKLLADICDVVGGGTPVCVAREMTKLHEEALRCSAGEALEELSSRERIRGEFVLVVGVPAAAAPEATDEGILAALREAVSGGTTKKEAVTFVSAALACPKNRVYRLSLKLD
jgi:16S rRNA (cytidine1402-2'-O)-methyltransferase